MPGGELRKEFQILNGYGLELRDYLDGKKPIKINRLLEIGEHIRKCDGLAEGRFEVILIHFTRLSWQKSIGLWRERQIENGNIPRFPHKLVSQMKETAKKVYDFDKMLTPSDRRWLKSLRIDNEDPLAH